jgi:hypothetical protein
MIATRAPDLILVMVLPFGLMLVACAFCLLLFRLLSLRN